MRIAAILATAAVFASPLAVAAAQFGTDEVRIRVETVADGLQHPWGMAELPDGSILVTERAGKLWRIAGGERREIGGLPEVAAAGQGGLLDIAADEDFARNRKLYISWSEPGADGYSTALSTATLPEGANRLENLERIFAMRKKTRSGQHFGSRIVLAPDGTLFLTMGDRGDPDRAQDPFDHAGKVVRLRRDGSIPDDNPFADGSRALPEIWSLGHRNPQGAAWRDGALWTVEHGARGGDEINRPQAGLNYGWPVISYGRHYSGGKIGVGAEAPGFEQPLWYWDPSIAPSGMTFYEGALFPQWRGDMFVGALKDQMLVRLELADGKIVAEERMLESEFGRIRAVETFSDGAIYLLTDEEDGALLRIVPASAPPSQ